MARRGPRLTIPARIFLSIVVVLLAFGAASAASVYQHHRTAERLRLLEDGYLPLAMSIGQLRASHAVFQSSLERLRQDRDPTDARWWLDGARRVRPAGLERARVRLRRAERLAPPPEDAGTLAEVRENLTEIRAAYRASEEAFGELYDATERDRPDAAREAEGRLEESERAIQRRLHRTWLLVQSRIGQISRSAAEQEQQFVYVIAAMALVALLVGLIVIWWSNRLLAPLPRLQRRVAAVAKGDFAGPIEAARDDEIGQLTTEFERMVEALGKRDRQLREAAEGLRELQHMQEQIVTGLRAGVVVVDGEGVVRSANRAAGEVLGVGDTAIDRPLKESALLERLPGLGDAIERVAEGGPPASLTAAPVGGDVPRFVDVLVTPFGTDESEEARRAALVVADDVTEELHTKQLLLRTERLAVMGRMAAHITHEVRNPLSSIGLNVELLEDEVIDAGAETKALLRSIQREIDRLTAITEEYLDLARLPAPRLEAEAVGELVAEVGRFVAREFETTGVALRVEVGPDLPLVAADERQIRQALLNLLRNARESMPEGGEVELRALRAEGGMEILVRDGGEGIPRTEQGHVFELFYSTKERGTGLGLPLTQQIVNAHGGTIRCEDAPEGGTVFRIFFPAAKATSLGARSEIAIREE